MWPRLDRMSRGVAEQFGRAWAQSNMMHFGRCCTIPYAWLFNENKLLNFLLFMAINSWLDKRGQQQRSLLFLLPLGRLA
jgi:hypothetical protein